MAKKDLYVELKVISPSEKNYNLNALMNDLSGTYPKAYREYRKMENKIRYLEMKLKDSKRPFWKKKYPSLSFWDNFFGGHIDVFNICIYGENAMRWAVNIKTRFGYICFRLPFRCFGEWWPLYFYISPNATPRASTFYRGSNPYQKKNAAKRRKKYGWNYDTKLLTPEDK